MTDERGGPVAGALVLARLHPPVLDVHHGTLQTSAAVWERTTAGADGRFAFDDLPPGAIDVFAAWPGTESFVSDRVEAPAVAEVPLVLPGLLRVEGRVTDEESGAPIAGVVMTTLQDSSGYEECGAFTVSGAGGAWAMDVLPHDGACARPMPTAGFVPGDPPVRGEADPACAGDVVRVDWTMHRTASLGVEVSGLDVGAGPMCVSIGSAEDDPTDLWPGPMHWPPFVDGRFRIDDILPGRVRLAAFPAGLSAQCAAEDAWREAIAAAPWALRRTEVELAPGTAVDVALRAVTAPAEDDEARVSLRRREFRFRVHVTTKDGLPLRNARVDAGRYGSEFYGRGSTDGYSVSADGTATCDASIRGEESMYGVVAWDDRHAMTWVAVTLPDPADAAPADGAVEIALDPAITVRGRVVCDGAPVAGARIDSDWAWVATTDAAGAFSFRAPQRRIDAIGVSARGFVRREVRVPDRPAPETAGPPSPPCDHTPKPGGCDCCRAAPASSRAAHTAPPVDPPEVVCELERARDLAGRVVDAAGRPVHGLLVQAEESLGSRDAFVCTDADGRFVLRDWPARTQRVVVRPRKGRGPASAPARFAATFEPDDRGDRTFVARPGETIAGRVLAEGEWRTWHVVWTRTGPDSPADAVPAGREEIDGDGRFEIRGLDPGDYELRVDGPDREPPPMRVHTGATDVEFVVR